MPVWDFPIEHGRLEGRNQRWKKSCEPQARASAPDIPNPLAYLSTEDGTHPSAEEAALPALGQAPGHPVGLTGTSAQRSALSPVTKLATAFPSQTQLRARRGHRRCPSCFLAPPPTSGPPPGPAWPPGLHAPRTAGNESPMSARLSRCVREVACRQQPGRCARNEGLP